MEFKSVMATGRKKSPIWVFFTVSEDSRLAKCKVCENEVSCRGQSTKSFTTTNLVYHLKIQHDEEYAQYNRLKADSKDKQNESFTSEGMPLRQVSLQETAELRKMWDINDSRVKKIYNKVGIMIAINCQPVSVIDHEGFRSLISTLEPKYQMPSRKYFSETIIPPIGNRIRANIATQLKEGAEYLSFTTDCWSSDVNSDALLGFTAHWVDGNFQRQSAVLHAQELLERHIGEYIAVKITRRMEDHFITGPCCHQRQWG